MARKRASISGLKSLEKALEDKARELPPPGTTLEGQEGEGPALVDVQQARKRLMTPCTTREEFAAWLRTYLNLDFPDQKVDEDSTGSPLDELWRVYQAGVTNDPSFPARNLLYASRASYKTLGVAALELLAILHMDRNVVHLAAIEQQAEKAQEYLRNFLGKEGLDEFNVGNNKRSVACVWAKHKKTGDLIIHDEWKKLTREQRREYVYHARYAKVIVNTMQSSNSDHVAFFVVDEVDVIRFPLAYEEAKLIPEAQRSAEGIEQPPITILTSTRKSSGGLVQREIDQAEDTGLSVRHWNILDVTRRCPDDRHRPDLPKLKVWTNEDLQRLLPEEYEKLKMTDAKKAADYTEREVYWGCVNNCPARVCSGCRGRLAGVTSTAAMLKAVPDTVRKFIEVSAEMAIAQVMCWKPGNEGAIYKHWSRKKHMLSLTDMWETITGEPHPHPVTLTKQGLVDMLIARNVKWAAGMDFGYTHNFAVSLWAIDGRRAFLIDAFEVPQFELNQKLELCEKRLGPYKKHGLVVWPDPAYPSDIKSFRGKGFIMKTHTKDVIGGINAVRNKLDPGTGREPELFVLKDDPAGTMMAVRFESYKWKLDAQGRPTDEPDDFEDDTMDGVRYIISNEFRGAGKVVSPKEAIAQATGQAGPTPKTWMQDEISKRTGAEPANPETKKIRRGGFFASFD